MITSTEDPSGGLGALEIVWITRQGTSGSWTTIAGATGLTYDPGIITTTTQYRRCARRAGCTSFVGESNIITMTVTGPCCDNVTNGGVIAANQSNCGPFDPAMLTSVSLPSGGTGVIEYVWLTSTNGGNNYTVIAGATGPTYDPGSVSVNTWFRRCARRAGCVPYVGESNWVQITVNPNNIVATCTPTNGTCNNDNAASASVSATGGTAPFTYLWSTGATTAQINNLTAGSYSVTVTDVNGCTAVCTTSVSITPCCNVTDPGEIAANGSGCAPFDSPMITSTEDPSGGLGALEIVWITRQGTSGSWTTIAGATGLTYDPGVITTTTQYRRCARRAGCTSFVGESNIITMTVTGPCCDNVTNGGVIAANQQNCGPFDPALLTSVSLPSGGTGVIEYVWLTSTNGGNNYTVIAGANGPTYDPGSVSVTTWFRRCARRAGCVPYVGESNWVQITVNPNDIVATCTPTNGTCSNDNEASASVSATGGTAPFTYLWSTGATTVSISNLTAGSYSVTVTDVNGCTAVCSTSVSITPCCNVTDPGEIAANGSGCAPFDPPMITSTEAPSGGLGALEIVWITRPGTSGPWSTIAGATGLTYNPGVITETTQYRRCARRAGCTSYVGESNIITMTVTGPCCDNVTNGGVIATNQQNCGPFDPALLTSVSLPSGGTGVIEYVWLTSTNGGNNYTVIAGANGPTYDPGSVSVTTWYRRCARRAGCVPYVGESNWVQITVNPNDIVADCDSENGTCANNNEGSASVAASGGTAPYTYLWSTGATTVSISNLTAGSYSVTVTDANGCSDDCSVTITTTPCCNVTNGGQIAAARENCGPFDPAAFTSVSLPSGGLGDLEYVWLWNPNVVTSNTGNNGWVVIPNSNSATYDPGYLTESKCFIRCARRAGCTSYIGESNVICVTVNPGPTATCTPTNGTCANNNEGSATVSMAGGTAPYTYDWSNGGSTATISGLAAGTYDVTVTDANGCSDDCSVTITTTPCCNVTSAGEIAASQENCGGFDPAAFTSVSLPSGGLGTMEYVWIVRTIGGSWSTVAGANGPTYDAPYTNVSLEYRRCARRSGCTSYIGESNILTITVNPGPTATCTPTNGTCANNNEGSATVSMTGGTAPYTYDWSNGGSTATISGLAAGTYDVTVTDANGCSDDCSVTITTTPCCNATDPGTVVGNQENCGPFDPAAFTSTAPATGGLGTIEYQWYEKETETSWMPIPGATSATYDPGMTSVNKKYKRCARRSGCTDYDVCSDVIDIMVHPDNINPTCSNTPVDCFGGSTGSATADVQGGTAPYSYAWSNGGSTQTISGLAAGTYIVTITDVNGCSNTCSTTVGQPADLTANCDSENGGCGNNNMGSASVTAAGGTSPYSYAWSNGATTASISNLAAGAYSVTVTDANGCTEICYANVTVEPCCNVTDAGEIAANQENCGPFDPVAFTSIAPATGGLGPVEYVWLRGSCGTSVNTWTEIPNSNSTTIDVGMVTETTCFIRCARNVGCTSYIGESNIITITVNPDNVVASCSSTPVDCNGTSTGSATVAPSGGVGPYTVLWSTGATTLVVNNLMAGSYSVTVTDVNGCSETCSSTVEEPATVVATCSSIDGNCNNNNEASASVSAAGGVGPYTYAWSNGATTSSIDGLAAGTYDVTVTDANGCSDDCSVTVTVTPCCNVTSGGQIEAAQENCGAFDPDRITSVSLPAGGLGTLEYVWLKNNQNVPMNNGNNGWVEIANSNSATYDPGTITETTCYIRCARRSGCTTYLGESNVVCMTVNPEPVATCTPTNGTCSNDNVASATVSVSNGTAPYSYAWSNGATTATISGLADGTYDVTVTDANGCSDDCSVTVTTTPCCNVSEPGDIAGNQENCGPFDPAAFTSIAPATGGLGGVVYQWYDKETETSWQPIPGANGETYDPGMISINTKFKRCAKRVGCPEFELCTDYVEITIHPAFQATCMSNPGSCNNGNGASATVNVQGGTSPFTYAWSNGETTATISGLAAGNYSVVVTDANGCTDDCNVNVTVEGCCNVTNPGSIAANQENCGAFDPVAFTSVAPASGGIGPVEYVWLRGACGTSPNTWAQIPNSNSETIDVGMVTETTCFIRCARNSGCSPWVGESNIITVTVNGNNFVATCASTDGDCSNDNLGTADVSVTGGNGPFGYEWSNGQTTAFIGGLAEGTYSVTVTDANGCVATCSTMVSIAPCCDVTEPGEVEGDQSNCGPFDPAAFTSIAPATGGLGTIEYQWFSKETETSWTPIQGATGATYDPGMLSINTKFKRCAKQTGCPGYVVCSNVIEIEIFPTPTATCERENGNCNNGNVGSASVSATGGTAPYTYLWSTGATTVSISNLTAGSYSVTVTDVNGCSDDCSVDVELTPCCNVTDAGEIAANQDNCGPFDPAPFTSVAPATGGIGPVEYVWLRGACGTSPNTWAQIPNSNSETIDVGMVTETTCFIRCARNVGCTDYIGESNIITVTVGPGCCDNVTDGGEIAASQENCGPFSPGAFTSVVDPTGGSGNLEYVWLQNDENVPMNNGNNGWVEIPNSNSATYDPGMVTETTCYIRCARRAGCVPYVGESNVVCITINPADLTATCTPVNGDCNNGNAGSASVSVTGGEAPYSYSWSNGETTASISGLGTGTYTVTVTDANGCTDVCDAIVEVTGCCNVTDGGEIAASQENCGPFDPAAFTSVVDPTGGLGDLEYVWLSNDENVPMNNGNNGWVEIPNSNSATYDPGMVTETTCYIRCARRSGCTVYVGESNVICVTVNEAPVATCTPVDGNCANDNQASASVSAAGGTAPYTYLWSTGATTVSISNLTAGSYSVTVTDVNGCSDDCSVDVELTPCCNVTDAGEIAANQDNCGPFDPAPFTSVAPATGGIGPVEYVWLSGACGTPVNTWTQLANSNSETYDAGMVNETTCFIRCARNAGCTDFIGESNIITITVGPGCCDNVTAGGEIAASQENCGPFSPGAFTSVVDPTGGSGNLEYVWLSNDENVPMNNGNNGWVEIANSNSATYDPGVVTETTCYIRCARRAGCVPYVGESNVVCITINPADLSATCTPVNGDCNNGNAGSASVSVSGGAAPYTYAWSNGETAASISGLATGTYTVTVTDANGCTDVCDAIVELTGCCNVVDPGSIAANQENCGPLDVEELTDLITPTGGVGNLEIIWITRAGTSGPWQEIVGADGLTYDPGIVSVTTQFRRCVRREGCTDFEESNIITITIFPQPEVVCNPTHGDCSNNGVGAVATTITGGAAPFSYVWSNGATTADISGLAAGTYSVLVTDANGCTADCMVDVVSEPCCNVTDGGVIAGVQENCGPFDPAAFTSSVPATGGIGPVEYIWLWNANNVSMNNGQNGWVEIPGSTSETYDPGYLTESRCFIRCARNVGCTTYIGESNVVCITINEAPVADCIPTNGDCTNGNVASASVSVSSGTAPFSYEWSNGATTASITDLAEGTYSVIVTDANGCTDDCSVTVSITPCCNVTDGGEIAANQENCGPFDPAAFTSVVPATGGIGPVEYIWLWNANNVSMNNGQNGWLEIPGSTSESYDPGMLTESRCFIRCARNVGCTTYIGESNVVCITVNEAPVADCTPTNGDCNNGNVASASVSVSSGTAPFSYEWSTSTGSAQANGATTASITDLAEGTYSVVVTDANGCTDDCSVTVTITPCCNVTDGGEIAAPQENCGPFDPAALTSVTPATGGLGNLEYIWLMNDENVPMNNGQNGWVEIPGSTGESYDPGMLTETTCFIRCARREGCTTYVGETNVICITIHPNDVVALCSMTPVSCNAGNDGEASVSASGGTAPYTYVWNNGVTTRINGGLATGTYSVVVTDANGCTADCSVEVTGSDALTAECDATDGTCATNNLGEATVAVTGGATPYSYAWSNGSTDATITNVAAGTYTVVVTDANGCTATCDATVEDVPCCNVTDAGEIAANQENCTAFDPAPFTSLAPATGGIGPVEYVWLRGECGTPVNTWAQIANSNSETLDVDSVFETTCFIRCARNAGCTDYIGESNIITITIQNALTIECSSISGDCGNGNMASASVDVIDGTAPFTYEWSTSTGSAQANGATTQSIENLTEGTYTVTVTDANGCSASCTEDVIVTPCCNVTDGGEIAANQENCGPFDPAPFTSVAPATGGIGPVEYLWLRGECGTPINTWAEIANSNSETLDVDSVFETTCFIRCSRNESCEPWIGESNIITVTVYPAITLSCNGVDGDCTNDNIATAIAHVSGGVEPYTISWSNGETTAMIDSLEAGTYTVTVTDANGCEATCTTTVAVTPCCNVTDGGEIDGEQENCGAFNPNEIVSVAPATGGLGPVEYAWWSGPCGGQGSPTAIPAGFTLIAGATGESYDPGMLSETTCFIRVSRNQGCQEWLGESNIVTITVNPNPTLTCTSENGDCENGNVGSASVTVSAAPSPFTYAWSNGETTASIGDLAEGTYSVVVTDANGCVDSCSTSIEVLPCCNVTDGGEIDGEQENCGPFDPSEIANVTPATGGIGPVEYAWWSGPCGGGSPTFGEAIPAGFSLIVGATNATYDPDSLMETTCFIRVAKNEGCTDWIGESNIITITVHPAPIAACSSENGDCENGNLGSASVTVSGGPSPFTYAWSNGGTTASISQLEPGTYAVTVTDANGCVDSCSVVVENEGCCNVTDGGEIEGGQENCGPFDPTTITSVTPATGGIGPVEYTWYSGPCPQGSPTIGAPTQGALPAGFVVIAGATDESYDPGMLNETTCFIRCSRNAGCTDYIGESNIITITIYEVPEVELSISGGASPMCSDGSVELTATSSTATSFEWSTGENGATISVTEAGVYVVTAYNADECAVSDSISIEVHPAPEVEIEVAGGNPFCNGDSTMLTAVCASATGYTWSTGSTDASIWVTTAGTYEVEVLDTNGCTGSTSIEVEVYELPEVEVTIDGNNPLCAGDSALLTAVSQGAEGYEWSTGETTESIWVYAAGTYSVTVADQVGCENNASYEVIEGLTPLLEITGDSVACAGASIELTAQYAGGEGVSWSTGEITQSIVVLQAGEYCVTTVSIDGCSVTDCINVEFNPLPEVEVEITAGTNPLCPGSEVELTATSATAVDYAWSTTDNGPSIVVDAAGTYTVEVTDANGCSSVDSIAIEEGLVPLIEVVGDTEFCLGDSIMLTAQYAGGEGVTWSTGETTQDIWVSAAGEYCVTTVSFHGCEANDCLTVNAAEVPNISAGADIEICEDQSATLTATGGNAGTTYTWYVDGLAVDTGMTIVVAPGVGITEYSVVATNQNCSVSDEDHVKVYVYAYPEVGFTRDPAGDVAFGEEVQFTDTTAGNVTDWSWNFGDGHTSMLQNPSHDYEDPGAYWVELIASNHGCADTARAGLEVKIIIDIPNVFTPNADGQNDEVWLQGTDLNNISMLIFNRWGHSVYASEGRQFSWSGKTTDGVECEAGTYYYVIQMEHKDGNVSEQTGFITLIRTNN